jgi:DNA/RNA-binding domain of Phe-tRNA-synthetase-like protein
MFFRHSDEIWGEFPQLVPGVVALEGLRPPGDVEPRLEPLYLRASSRLSEGPESEMPEITAWRRAFAQMGLKPTKYRSAAEALLRRFRLEKTVPRVHPLIDLCNAVSLAFAIPVAVFDVDRVDEFLELHHATGTESYLAFSGEMETPVEGEVIFADAAGRAHARRWTFRQSRESIVTDATVRALVVAEGLHETASRDVPALLDSLMDAGAALASEVPRRGVLTRDHARFDFYRGSSV